MQEQDGNNFDITARLEELRQEQAALVWEGSFRDYFELVTQNPRLAELSHARLNDMIHAAGVEKLNEGTRDEVAHYRFFSGELFGIEEPIARIVEYFKSAAQRLEVRKRILLLMGPVGGGKSTIVTMLKRGLEEWTRNDTGAAAAHDPQRNVGRDSNNEHSLPARGILRRSPIWVAWRRLRRSRIGGNRMRRRRSGPPSCARP